MRALFKTAERITLDDLPVPKPGPGEVTVKVQCAGLCRTDLQVASGALESESPRILGHESSGVICRLGSGVDQNRLGESVAVFPWLSCGQCEFCQRDSERMGYLCPLRRFLGWHVNGCFSEFMVVPSDRCLSLNEKIDFQAGAYLEPLTAALGVMRAPLSRARRVAVLGDNRIAGLTSILLSEYAQIEHKVLDPKGELTPDSFDLIIETDACEFNIEFALRSLIPDGVLVLKSRPSGPVKWPVRLQVEKEITVMALSYGSLALARILLEKRTSLFQPLWLDPVPLSQWELQFEHAWAGIEEKKVFFLPQAD